MSHLFRVLIFLASALSAGATGELVMFSPNRLSYFVEGNDSTLVPFSIFRNEPRELGPVHYQQLYLASEFDALPRSGAYLFLIGFRTDPCAPRGWVSGFDNFTIRLSTTQRQPQNLSTNLSENHGTDRRLVYQKAHSGFGPNFGTCQPGQPIVPESVDANWFFLSNSPPFLYSPVKGNLLLDLQFSQRTVFPAGSLGASVDAETSDSDGVSRIYCWEGLNGTECRADSTAAVTFFYWIVPRINVTRTNGVLTLEWPGTLLLPTFILQTTDRLDATAKWTKYTGVIDPEPSSRATTTIPISSLIKSRYYRLFSDAPVPTE